MAAPARADSYIACIDGDGVWCTIGGLFILARLAAQCRSAAPAAPHLPAADSLRVMRP